MARSIKEYRIPFRGYETYVRVAQGTGSQTLLVLHGGPGSAHDYLTSLDGISEEITVIYYDQVGCGRSTPTIPQEEYTVKTYIDEINAIRQALQLTSTAILGHSWGAMLLLEYMLTNPEGVERIILSSGLSSVPLWMEEGMRLSRELPVWMQTAIGDAIETKDFQQPDYLQAVEEYYKRHVCNMQPSPKVIEDLLASESEVYSIMYGQCEFYSDGILKDWDVTDQLHRINVPALVISGTDDEATPRIAKTMVDRLPDSRWELLVGTHSVHLEQQEQYNKIVSSFLI